MAFSIPRNWNRLTEIKTGKSEQWRAIQGVRFYNMLIVIFVHTVMGCIMGPVANTKFTEKVSNLITIHLFDLRSSLDPFVVVTTFR